MSFDEKIIEREVESCSGIEVTRGQNLRGTFDKMISWKIRTEGGNKIWLIAS